MLSTEYNDDERETNILQSGSLQILAVYVIGDHHVFLSSRKCFD